MSPAALLLALAACKGSDEVAETATWDRLGVDDFTPEGGPSATIWVQGNADFVEGAEACADDVCETTDAEGIARLLDLPEGEVAIRVDGGDGVPLLLGLTLRNDFVPHLAARSLTPGIYRSWLGAGVWADGTGLVDVWPIDATDSASAVMPGVALAAEGHEVWAVADLASARPDDTSTGTGPLWVPGVPPGEVELALTFDAGICEARAMGWAADTPSDPTTLRMRVPVEADRATSVYVHCVEVDAGR